VKRKPIADVDLRRGKRGGASPSGCRSKSSGIFLFVSRIVPNWAEDDSSRFPSFYALIPHPCCTVTLKSHDGFIDLG
jgi:hypothetical protein